MFFLFIFGLTGFKLENVASELLVSRYTVACFRSIFALRDL